jgi:hypothetical protein
LSRRTARVSAKRIHLTSRLGAYRQSFTSIDKTVHDSLEADPHSYAGLPDRCVPEVLFLDEGKNDQIVFNNDTVLLNHSTEFAGGRLSIAIRRRSSSAVDRVRPRPV